MCQAVEAFAPGANRYFGTSPSRACRVRSDLKMEEQREYVHYIAHAAVRRVLTYRRPLEAYVWRTVGQQGAEA